MMMMMVTGQASVRQLRVQRMGYMGVTEGFFLYDEAISAPTGSGHWNAPRMTAPGLAQAEATCGP